MSVSFRILILISVEGHLYVARISRWPSVVPRSFCVTRYVDPHCWNDGWIKEMSNNSCNEIKLEWKLVFIMLHIVNESWTCKKLHIFHVQFIHTCIFSGKIASNSWSHAFKTRPYIFSFTNATAFDVRLSALFVLSSKWHNLS